MTTIVINKNDRFGKAGRTVKNALTKTEWAVMSALWRQPGQTISGLIEALEGQTDWKYNTYVTYLKRMAEKGLVRFEQAGRDRFYFPAVPQSACLHAESESLLDKMDARAAKEFLVCMIKGSGLDAKDRGDLKRLLDDLSKEGENE